LLAWVWFVTVQQNLMRSRIALYSGDAACTGSCDRGMAERSKGHGLGFALTGFPQNPVDDTNQKESDNQGLAFHCRSLSGLIGEQPRLVFYCLVVMRPWPDD